MKPSSPYRQVAILGLGLIGGSLARDVKQRRLAEQVVGYNRSESGRKWAIKLKACDLVYDDAASAVRDADLVVLATPVSRVASLAEEIASHLKRGCTVTDVGSTKREIVRELSRSLPKTVDFIGGHPIAGTANAGMEFAELNLFEGKNWILTSTRKTHPAAQRKLEAWLKKLGARVSVLDPREHDRIFAQVSHLPQLAAYALVQAVSRKGGEKALRYAGSGFRDTTRIAASEAAMWVDIAMQNRGEILPALREYLKQLRKVEAALESQSAPALEKFFEAASRERKKL